MSKLKILRKKRIRGKLKSSSRQIRVLVIKSIKYDYLQAFDDNKKQTITSLSTKKIVGKNRKEKAQKLAKKFAEILISKDIKTIVFDRSGYKYHGRVKNIAETLRESGIKF